jgi:hypothetical protein
MRIRNIFLLGKDLHIGLALNSFGRAKNALNFDSIAHSMQKNINSRNGSRKKLRQARAKRVMKSLLTKNSDLL